MVAAIRDHQAKVTLAAVELDEGPWIAGALEGPAGRDCDVTTLIGAQARLHVVRFTQGEPIPAFRLS
ncbi:Uncharacterised protein [Mycobacteroides abscessus subsp. abscessus]|nr:Uncharacterised protein [Mycobacteroides abscessus subsp. abscessus]